MEVVGADSAATLRPAFFAAFLDLAQRAFCAAAILARASALMVRTALDLPAKSNASKLVALLGDLTPAKRPGFRLIVASVPVRSTLACCSRKISASISRTRSFVFIYPPL